MSPNNIKEEIDVFFPGDRPPQRRTAVEGLPIYYHPSPDTCEDEEREPDDDCYCDTFNASVSNTVLFYTPQEHSLSVHWALEDLGETLIPLCVVQADL